MILHLPSFEHISLCLDKGYSVCISEVFLEFDLKVSFFLKKNRYSSNDLYLTPSIFSYRVDTLHILSLPF